MPCLIAAPASGSGKTLVSLALTALARRRGRSIQTFKVGPDYLDPQLLTAASGRPCRNLDPLLCGEAWVQGSFQQHGSTAEDRQPHQQGKETHLSHVVQTLRTNQPSNNARPITIQNA